MYIDKSNLFNLNKKKLYVKLHNSSTTESKDNGNIDFSSLRILSSLGLSIVTIFCPIRDLLG